MSSEVSKQNKIVKRVLLSLSVWVMFVTFSGCAPSWKSQNQSPLTETVSPSSELQAPPTQQGDDLPSQVETGSLDQALQRDLSWQELELNEWAQGEFHSSPQATGPMAGDRVYGFSLSMPYGLAFDATSMLVKLASKQVCPSDQLQKSAAHLYRSGEIPCGRILDDRWKLLTTLVLPDTTTTKSGTTLSLKGFEVPIRISRFQGQGLISEDSLDQKQVIQRVSNSAFGRDISLQYIPHNTRAEFRLCGNFPGVLIDLPERVLEGRARKKVLGQMVSVSGSGTVNFGNFSYSHVRSCARVEVAFDPQSRRPQLKILQVESPQVANGAFGGFRVRFNEGWLQFVDAMSDLFGPGIIDSLERTVNREIANFTKQDLETGRWLDAHIREALQKDVQSQVDQVLQQEITQQGLVIGADQLKTRLARECRKLKLHRSLSQVLEPFVDSCENFVQGLEFSVSPFHRDPELEAKGCYSHLASLSGTKNSDGSRKWWARQCAFRLRVQVRVPEFQTPDLKAFRAFLDQARQEAQALSEDLEELVRQGKATRAQIQALADAILREHPELRDISALKEEIKRRL